MRATGTKARHRLERARHLKFNRGTESITDCEPQEASPLSVPNRHLGLILKLSLFVIRQDRLQVAEWYSDFPKQIVFVFYITLRAE